MLIINFYITYFEILAVCVFAHINISLSRRLLGALSGAVFALAVFIPQSYAILAAVVKAAACFVIALIVFGIKDIARYFKLSLILLIVNFIFAGITLFIWLFLKPANMLYSNGTLYFDIDIMMLLICTAVAYVAIKAIRLLLDKNGHLERKYSMIVHNENHTCTLSAMADSGNGAVDYFSGMPVIICRKDCCADISPPALSELICGGIENIDKFSIKGIKILPCSTISGNGIIYAFKAESIIIKDLSAGSEYRVKALIGVSPDSRQEFDAVFNPKLLI